MSHLKLIQQSRRAASASSPSETDAAAVSGGIPGYTQDPSLEKPKGISLLFLSGCHTVPRESLLPPLFLPLFMSCCSRLEKESASIATSCFVSAGIVQSLTVGGCSTR